MLSERTPTPVSILACAASAIGPRHTTESARRSTTSKDPWFFRRDATNMHSMSCAAGCLRPASWPFEPPCEGEGEVLQQSHVRLQRRGHGHLAIQSLVLRNQLRGPRAHVISDRPQACSQHPGRLSEHLCEGLADSRSSCLWRAEAQCTLRTTHLAPSSGLMDRCVVA